MTYWSFTAEDKMRLRQLGRDMEVSKAHEDRPVQKFREIFIWDNNALLCWREIQFEDIKPGQKFRMYECDGMLVAEGIAATAATPIDPPGNYQFTTRGTDG